MPTTEGISFSNCLARETILKSGNSKQKLNVRWALVEIRCRLVGCLGVQGAHGCRQGELLFFWGGGAVGWEQGAPQMYSNLPAAHPSRLDPTPRHPQGSGSGLQTWGLQNSGAIVWSRVPAQQSNAASRTKIIPHAKRKRTGVSRHQRFRRRNGAGREREGDMLLTLFLVWGHMLHVGWPRRAGRPTFLRKTAQHPTENCSTAARQRQQLTAGWRSRGRAACLFGLLLLSWKTNSTAGGRAHGRAHRPEPRLRWQLQPQRQTGRLLA